MRTVRLSKKMEQQVDNIARQKNISRSQVIREALEEYVEKNQAAFSPFQTGEKWFGIRGSGETGRSVNYKARIKDGLRTKYRK